MQQKRNWKEKEEENKNVRGYGKRKLEIPVVITELDRSSLCNIYTYSFVLSLFCIGTLK